MSRRAVVICPGRGTYNKPELGYLARHHADAPLLTDFDAARTAAGQEAITALDSAARYSVATYSRGDVASPLIFSCSLLDALSLSNDIEIVAATGNSMGWYTALAVGGAVPAGEGFRIVNTMGTLMQQSLIGGQLVYPATGPDWRPDPVRKAALLADVSAIDGQRDCILALSIDLGGLLVLAGNEAGLAAFEATHPIEQERFPMRLANHAAFHTALQVQVAQKAREILPASLFGQPATPLIDGRGAIW
jgi:malonyl CoA-acyl carrier protein transacylase